MSAPANTTKQCIRCGLAKELSAFYCHPEMSDGLLGACKECVKAGVRANYARNRNHYVEYDKQREQTPERKEFKREQKLLYRARNPEKYRARNITGAAIRDGRLFKQPCSRCGANDNVHAHHHDYSKPLDVEWLCKDCHWDEHRSTREVG